MINIPVELVVFLISFPFLICLQIFLSRQENKILGLVLPLLNVILISIPRIIRLLSFGIERGEQLRVLIMTFLILNIPTIVFIVIYIFCRKKVKINKELKKMNIQDLD